MPKATRYLNAYVVKPNWCRCHPETCCCDDWAIYDGDELYSTYFRESEASEVCAELNNEYFGV